MTTGRGCLSASPGDRAADPAAASSVADPDRPGHAAQGPERTELARRDFWFLVLAVITALGALSAAAESVSLLTVLGLLATGSEFLAAHYPAGVHWWEVAGGRILIGSAVAATYTARAMMLEGACGRVVLPPGKVEGKANLPGSTVTTGPVRARRVRHSDTPVMPGWRLAGARAG